MAQQTNLQSSQLTEQEINSIETFYRAFTDKAPGLLNQVCTPDWEDIPLVPGQSPGPNGLKQIMPMFFTAFPDLKIVIHEIVGAEGRAGVRASIVGTHLGELFGVAPTGRLVEVALHEFHHFKNGRLTHTWHLEDWFGMLNQLGAWSPNRSAQKEDKQ